MSLRVGEEDTFVFEMVGKGEQVDGLLPMNAEWTAKFEEWKARRRA